MSRRDDDPTPMTDALARVRAELGLPASDDFATLASSWVELLGDDAAAHTSLEGVRDGVLTIAADSTPWASQLRYLETTVLERAAALVGPDVVISIRVRVRPS